ncbi:MAG: hypothetical protein K9M51_02830 [Candidatus Gracilibacteria bacterium]|nr:hypothetical protein [Candidatus Gracilibacteria bacterium]
MKNAEPEKIIHSVLRPEKIPETGKQRVESAINSAYESVMQILEDRTLTVMDMHAFPADLAKRELILKLWFEKEFFPLETEEDFEKFTRYLRLGLESLESGKLQFSSEKQLARSVWQQIERGFSSLREVQQFFQFVACDQKDFGDDFLVDEKKGKKGHERYSACRVLKRSLALFAAEKHITSLRDWAEYLFGRQPIPGGKEEGGVLSGIHGHPEDIDEFFSRVEKREQVAGEEFYNWLAVGKFVENPVLSFEGKPPHAAIKRVEIGLKDSRKAIDKLERGGKVAAEKLDDLFRIRVILDDEKVAKEDEALELLDIMMNVEHQIQKSAEPYDVDVESRDKNYLTPTQRKLFFNEKLPGQNQFSGMVQKMVLPLEKFNQSSGGEYRAMSQKIRFLDSKTKKSQFGFEIQYVTESNHKNNENEKTSGGHFMMELRNFAQHFSRMESMMAREEILQHIESFLQQYEQRYVEKTTQDFLPQKMKFPKSLKGDFRKTPGWRSHQKFGKFYKGGAETEKFSMDFRTKKSRAEAVFHFLWAEGHLLKVPQDFPRTLRATDKQLEASSNFLGTRAYENILNVVEGKV